MILLLVVDSDDNIIAELYIKHSKPMLFEAIGIRGINDGEEAVHDVFMKLISKFAGNMSVLRDKPRSFFIVAVRFRSLDLNKKRRETLFLDLDIGEDFVSTETPEDIVINADNKERLIRLLYTLTPKMQEILEYKYVLELSNKEIAEALGVSETIVSSRIDRAKKALEKKLNEQKAGE